MLFPRRNTIAGKDWGCNPDQSFCTSQLINNDCFCQKVSPGVHNRNSEYFVSLVDSDSITEIPIIKMILMSLHPSNNCAKNYWCTIIFFVFVILFHTCSLMMIACGLKHVGMLCAIKSYKHLKKNTVHFVGWVLWIILQQVNVCISHLLRYFLKDSFQRFLWLVCDT